MKNRLYLESAAWLLISLGVGAAMAGDLAPSDQPESRAKVEQKADLNKSSNKTEGAEVVDDLLTNNNLRALSGSLSKWSIASQLEYLGGTINDPLSQDRPNISAASGNTIKADMDGSISTKYNIDGKNSVMAGIGLRWIAPLAVGGPQNYNGTAFDAMNPYLQYQYVYNLAGLQSVLQIADMQWTQADQTALGYFQQVNVSQETIYAIKGTKLSVGSTMFAQYQFFNKSGSFGTRGTDSFIPDLAAVQSVWAIGFDPVLEYQLSAKVNLRTLVSLWVYEHYANQSGMALVRDNIYQSIGVGISVTRDIFLYPNVQFIPTQASADFTNVGLSATINVF